MTDEYDPQADAAPDGEDSPAARGNGADLAAEAAEAVHNELEALKAKSAEYLEGWQRARAEFANYKRRVEKEQSETYQNATARVIGRFLDVMDDFDRAMQEKPAEPADAEALSKWAAGVDLIRRKLQNVLDVEGVERMVVEGQPFDPNFHEAVTQEDSDDYEPGHVIGAVRPGYRMGDRVIRPAMVRVAK
jgi:molecular chaperone GrpE